MSHKLSLNLFSVVTMLFQDIKKRAWTKEQFLEDVLPYKISEPYVTWL